MGGPALPKRHCGPEPTAFLFASLAHKRTPGVVTGSLVSQVALLGLDAPAT
jgi:hypothetical protein